MSSAPRQHPCSPRRRKVDAYTLLFPAAALYAAAAVPLSVLAMTAGAAWPPALIGAGHAHELLFGFALAVVAGYTVGPIDRMRLAGLFGLWAAARVAFLIAPFGITAGTLNALFALALATLSVPRFLAAKKWRNRIVSPLLLALCALPVAYAVILYRPDMAGRFLLSPVAVLLFALLMVFMGGRIIAPAAAGESERRGLKLEARVQPRLEAALIVLMAAAVPAWLLGWPLPAGLAVAAAGAVTAVRLLRWRLWRCRRRPDVIGLGVGYAWLAAGMLAIGAGLALGAPLTAAVHLITVGALGTLSTGVMARLDFHRRRRGPPPAALVIAMAALIGAAAAGRAAAATTAAVDTRLLLWAAAAAWSAAYLLLAFHLLQSSSQPPKAAKRA